MTRVLLPVLLLCWTAPAFAQRKEPIPPFAVDARMSFVLLKESLKTATTLDVTTDQLAGHTFGLGGGVHFYPLRRAGFAFGLGAEILLASASHQDRDMTGKPVGIKMDRRFQNLSGQMSLNFGKREGWSYLTGGVGPLAFDTYLDGTIPDRKRQMTINYGAGARWFNYDHVAFSLDLRIYLTKPDDATILVGGRDRQNIVVMSAGVSIK